MNKFIYALGNAVWKIGSDAHYNLLKNHFTPLPVTKKEVRQDAGRFTVTNIVECCPGCSKQLPLILLYHKDMNCCPHCGQAYTR